MHSASLPADPSALAAAILNGDLPASAAMGRADAYNALNAGANGALPFLGSSAKIDAGQSVGILSAVLYMLPAMKSGRQACPFASDGCTAACLETGTGRMDMTGPVRARIRRAASFFADRGRFLADVHREGARHERKARKAGKVPALRLNGVQDYPWHRMPFTGHDGVRYASIHAALPGIRFYEYTKYPLALATKGGLPANLHLTYSVSDDPTSDARAAEWLEAGYNAAVVTFTKRHEPPAWFALSGGIFPTVDGDAHDARFLDPAGHVVILAAKGRAKSDRSGFVRSI